MTDDEFIEKLNEITLQAELDEIKFRAEFKDTGLEDLDSCEPIYHPPFGWFSSKE
tara:strand:+ start:259 stop:423 length:165 start_codon:yes stop_codon:yes gene_type:complete